MGTPGISLSIFLLAVGAILRFAVDTTLGGIDLGVVGIILMIVGAIGLVIAIYMMSFYTRRTPPTNPPVPPAV